MSTVVDVVVNQEEFAALEEDFATQYQGATQAETAALRANVAATVAAHRLGVTANRLQPMVEAEQGKGNWTAYLKAHGMKVRTVQRAQRIARVLSDEQCANLTLEKADDLAAEKEAVARGNVKSAQEWRNLKMKLAEAREALNKKESEREKELADFEKKLEDRLNDEYQERAKELDGAAEMALGDIEEEAKEQAEENASTLNAAEMAEAIQAEEEGKASIPKPHVHGDPMPPEVAAELTPDEDADVGEKEVEEQDGLLSDDQIDGLAERLREIVAERPSELKDTIADATVQTALDNLIATCSGDPEIAFTVMAVWFSNSL